MVGLAVLRWGRRTGTAFYSRIGRRPNEGRVEGALGIWLADGRFVLAFGRDSDRDEIACGPVAYECALPFELWRVRVDGVGRAFARAEDVAVARDAFEEVELGGELRFCAWMEAFSFASGLTDGVGVAPLRAARLDRRGARGGRRARAPSNTQLNQ